MTAGVGLPRARRLVAPCLALPLLLAVACKRESVAERAERLRAGYGVQLDGYVVHEQQAATLLPEEAPLAEATPTPAPFGARPAGAAAASGDADPAVPPVQPNDLTGAPRDVVLDLVIRRARGGEGQDDERLPGLTVDISHVGADGAEKGHHHAYLAVSGIAPGASALRKHVLEQVDFTAGDRFEVAVVSPVPADRRGEYREFSPE